jgi:hypothetical protein
MPAIERIRFIIVNKKQETKLTFLRRLILHLLDILISEQNSFHVKKQTELIQLIAKLMSWTSKFLVSSERSTFKSLAKRIGSLGDMDLQMEVLKLMTDLAEEIKALPSPLFDESQQHQFDSIGMALQLKRISSSIST